MYFEESKNEFSVKIVDLPGIDAHNSNETNNAYRLAEKYIAAADLVLLVATNTDTSFFDPTKTKIPGIGDWRSNYHRFRLVTTKTVEAETFKDYLKTAGFISRKIVNERVLNQIHTHFTIPESMQPSEKWVFPIDVGDSWERFKSSDAHESQKQTMNEALGDLRNEIMKAATVEAKIQQILNIKEVWRGKIKEKEVELVELQNKLQASIENVKVSIDKTDSSIKTNQRAIERYETARRDLKKEKKECEDEIQKLSETSFFSSKTSTVVKTYVNYITEIKMAIYQSALQIRDTYQLKLSSNEIETNLSVCFLKIENILNGYTLDEYYPSISDNYKDDHKSIKNSSACAVQTVVKMLTEASLANYSANLECAPKSVEFIPL